MELKKHIVEKLLSLIQKREASYIKFHANYESSSLAMFKKNRHDEDLLGSWIIADRHNLNYAPSWEIQN